ncbi:MAG TPA: TolC family protein [Sedimentisphaerales bacterium]|nr:TolC family protein [Sedimentisphaerales bacterium]
MHRKACVLLFMTLAALAGCRVADGPSDDARAAWVRPKPVDTHNISTDHDVIVEPVGVVTLRDVLALALSRNPELGVYPYDLRAADARALQAGLRPNPELEVAIEEFAGGGDRSGFDGAETTVRIDQTIELGGKRARRARVAQFDRELTEWDYRAARLDVIREATQAFVAVQAAQDRVALARQVVELSEQAYAAVAQRVQAGRDSPVDELRASVALSTSRIELHKREKNLAVARHALAAVWGGRTPMFEKVAGDLYEVPKPVAPENLAAAISENPDIARWESQDRKQRAVLRLEQSKAMPDVTIGGGVRRFEETDDSALVLGVGVPIPLFDRNQGGIREATAELGKVRRQREVAQVRILAALAEATNALTASYEEATILRNDVLPKAEQAFAAARQGYEQGKFDYLYALDTQRTLFETQAGYIDAVEAYHKASAEVRRLIGALPAGEELSHSTLNPSSQEDSHER